MLLRPRQEEFRDKCVAALIKYGNTLGVAPTGAGKTIMQSAVAGSMMKKGETALIIQHREELVSQNRKKFMILNPRIETGLYTATAKSFRKQAVFSMVQTLSRDVNLDRMVARDLILIDEAHHAAANSYLKVINKAKELNPEVKILGVTATPERGDRKGLKAIFDNVADQITLTELIQAGHLVKPLAFVIDLGVQEKLQHVKRNAYDFDMTEVERILDHDILNEQIIAQWKNKEKEYYSGDRQTVIFCSTITHAKHVTEAFIDAGIVAAVVHSEMGSAKRKAILAAFERGDSQVIVNVAILTEGWDCPPCSCVILLRPSSGKSTMIQMIGRGLRTINPEEYPGIIKTDCIVLDFGTSLLNHRDLEMGATIEGRSIKPGEAPTKGCPECQYAIPAAVRQCPICGHEFPLPEQDESKSLLENIVMTEIDLFNASPFRYESLYDDLVLVATAFDAWVMVIHYAGVWYALGGSKQTGLKILAVGDRVVSIAAADDYLREHGDTSGARKSKQWLNLPASEKQLKILQLSSMSSMGITRYRAACMITWKFNQTPIKNKLTEMKEAA